MKTNSKLWRFFFQNRERARLTNAKNGVAVVEDDNVENAYDYDSDGRFINIKTALEGPIVKLAAAFVEASTFDNSKPFEDPHPQIFGGSFTQSVVSANIRVSVESRVHFALTLQTLLNAITEVTLLFLILAILHIIRNCRRNLVLAPLHLEMLRPCHVN